MKLKALKNLTILISFLFISLNNSYSSEKCGRSAIINYQEVMLDTTKKGEGLRFFLEKDEKSLGLLNRYQTNIAPKWHNAAIGSFGTALILFGMGKSGKIIGENSAGFNAKKVKEKRILIISGLAVLIINYLIIKTLEHANEKLLLRSIDEYNKRNIPKIFLTPEEQGGINLQSKIGYKYGLNLVFKEF